MEFKITRWGEWWPSTGISNIQLENNKTYTVTLDVLSTEKRKLHIVVKGNNGGEGTKDLGASVTEWIDPGEKKTISFTFTSDESNTDMNKAKLEIFLAKKTTESLCDSDLHTVFISNVSIVEAS